MEISPGAPLITPLINEKKINEKKNSLNIRFFFYRESLITICVFSYQWINCQVSLLIPRVSNAKKCTTMAFFDWTSSQAFDRLLISAKREWFDGEEQWGGKKQALYRAGTPNGWLARFCALFNAPRCQTLRSRLHTTRWIKKKDKN